MDDPFASPTKSIGRQRSRPNLAIPLPALPSSRSISNGLQSPDDDDETGIPPVPMLPPSLSSRQGITSNDLRQHLSSLLEQKTAQLQMLGQMGQAMVKQQSELEERMRDFDDVDSDAEGQEVDEGLRKRLGELEKDVEQWERANDGMLRELGAKVS